MRLSNGGGPHFTKQAVGKLLRQPHETHFHRRISTELEVYDHNRGAGLQAAAIAIAVIVWVPALMFFPFQVVAQEVAFVHVCRVVLSPLIVMDATVPLGSLAETAMLTEP